MDSTMYCNILKEKMVPSLQKLGKRAVFQHYNDPKHRSKQITAFLEKWKVKMLEWPSMLPDLNPIQYLWGILKCKVEEHWVSNIRQLWEVITEEWKNIPAKTSATLVNSMPNRIKTVLKKKWFSHKILTLVQILSDCAVRVYSLLLPLFSEFSIVY